MIDCRYDKFSFDITEAIEGQPAGHEHELLVQVFDPTGITPQTFFCVLAQIRQPVPGLHVYTSRVHKHAGLHLGHQVCVMVV